MTVINKKTIRPTKGIKLLIIGKKEAAPTPKMKFNRTSKKILDLVNKKPSDFMRTPKTTLAYSVVLCQDILFIALLLHCFMASLFHGYLLV